MSSVEQVALSGIPFDEYVAIGQQDGKRVAGVVAIREVWTDRPSTGQTVVGGGVSGPASGARIRPGHEDRAIGTEDLRADLSRREVAKFAVGSVLDAAKGR